MLQSVIVVSLRTLAKDLGVGFAHDLPLHIVDCGRSATYWPRGACSWESSGADGAAGGSCRRVAVGTFGTKSPKDWNA